MKFRHFFLALSCACLLAGCEKAPVQTSYITPDVVVAVTPFTQPEQTADLLSGYIPEDQAPISAEVLARLDELFRAKLSTDSHRYLLLSQADISGDLTRDTRGRRSALMTWAEHARTAGADMIVVPHIISYQERVGGEAGVVTPAAVNEDFYLINAGEPAVLVQRVHFAEEQQALSSNLAKIGLFLRRGGKWITADQLAAEGMDKAVEELGL